MLFVLGASGGLGSGIVELLNKNPALTAPYSGIRYVTRKDMDLTDENSIRSFWNRVSSDLPEKEPIHVINAAGFSKNGFLHKYSHSDWESTIDVNLTANFLILREFSSLVKTRPGSSMVILSSVVADLGVPGTIAYSASKAGLKGLVRTAAKELSRVNTTINAIELGYFNRGMIEQVPPEHLEKILAEIPLKRLGTIEELFQGCDFLLRCQYMTGSTLKLNGGLV